MMINRDNLTKLANYLLTVEPKAFSMTTFVSASTGIEKEYLRTGRFPCGTVACAAGYGPAAGIHWDQPDHYGWVPYIDNNFFSVEAGNSHDSPEYMWCFYDDWEAVDNTPKGAAARIFYMLKHGVPKRFTEPSAYYQRLANKALVS